MKSATTAQETLNQIYANRNLSSVYSIPRKQAGPGCCLQDVKVHGREWREISKIVQQSVMDRSTMARWQIDRIQLCRNPTLEERFIKKRQKMKEDGRSAKELTEQHAFHVVSHAKAKHVCQSGLVVCSGQTAFTNFLGRSDMGVYVRRNADIALKLAEKCSYSQTALMVFKITPGRIKPIPTSFKTIEDAIEPTPNFDSHVSNRLPTSIQKEAHQLANSCIYLYEYDDSCRPSKAPSQILPYAVVSCTKISPPKVLVASPIVSVTDVSSSDTDGLGSDMDIDDSGDEKECDVKTAESSGTSLSIETVKETQGSERNKKLSVGDIQDCNLGPSHQSETGVFLKPTPLLFGNKISQTVKQKTDPTTSQGMGISTLLKPAKFLNGNKESQTEGQSTVSSGSSGGTSSQRVQNMAAGFFAKLKDPRIQRGLRSNESSANVSIGGESRYKPKRKPVVPENIQEAKLKAKRKMRPTEHLAMQGIKEKSLDVLSGKTARRKKEIPVGHCLTKGCLSGKTLTVDNTTSKHMGDKKKGKPSNRLKEKIKRQPVLLADELEETHVKRQTQTKKKPEERVKETKTHKVQKGPQDGKLNAFERQLKKMGHTNSSKQPASVINFPTKQPIDKVKKGRDTNALLALRVSDSCPSDSEHTEMLSVLHSLDQTLDRLTPTVALSSSEMSDSASEVATLYRVPKVTRIEPVKMEESVCALAGQEEESKCLKTMGMPEQNISRAACIGCERNETSAGNILPKESNGVRSMEVKVDLTVDRMKGTDTNSEKESTAEWQAFGSQKPPEDSSPKKTMKQEPADASAITCPNSGGEADFSEENMMEWKKTCEEEEEEAGGTNTTMLVIDQVFSLAGNAISQVYAQEQEEKIIPKDTDTCIPYDLKHATFTIDGLTAGRIIDPQTHDHSGLPVSDARDLDSKAEKLETGTSKHIVRTTSIGVARPQTIGRSVSEDTSNATLGQRGATAGVRGEQDCQSSCQSQSCTWHCSWQAKEDTVLESLLTGVLNTLELGVQKLQATSDCPQLVVAVRTAATVAIRTSTTLLELAVQEVRDHISRKMDQMQGGTFQQPPLDCRKLESLISGTMNTLKMMSDDMGDSSLQSSFQTALTLLELAVDIVWVRGQPRGGTVVQPQLHPQTQGDNRATEVYHPMEGHSNVFRCGQWEESCGQAQISQWPTNEERAEQVTVDHEAFSMEEGHGSGHRQLTTTSTKENAKPVTPPPLPPPLPTFLSLTPQQLFTIARRQVDSPSIPSPDAAELGADYNGNLVGTSWKCRDSEPEGAVDRNKQTTRSWQANKLCTEMQTTSKVYGSCEDEEMTPNLSVDTQNMMADHDVKSHLEAGLEAGYRYEKIHLWTEEYARKIERFEESTQTTCDEPKPMETSGTKQESGMTGKEEMSTLKPKATFPSGDTRAGSEFAVSKENDGMRPLCCHPKKSTLKEEQDSSLDHQQVCVKPSGSAENPSTSSEQKGNREEESYAELTNKKEETNVLGTQKSEKTKEEESHDYENQKDKRAGNDSSTNSANLPSQLCSPQECHLADDSIERLADDVPMLSDDDDHDLYSISNDFSLSSSLLSTSVGGQSFSSSSANDSFLCGKEKDVTNTSSEGISRPFSCFAPLSKGEPTDKESRCTFSAKLAATANIDPTLGNKLAMAAELPTKLSCPKMLINEHCTKSSVREETAQGGGRQKEKEAYERARKRWTRLFKSLVHQGDNNKADREVKAEEQQKCTDSFSATVHGSEVETKAELEQNTSGHTRASDSHKACNSSVLFKAKGGSVLSNCCKDSGSSLSQCKSEMYETFGMKRPQSNAIGGEEQMLHNQEKPASSDSTADRNHALLYNAIQMSQDSQLYEAPFDFDMVLSCARSSHAQQMFQCIADRMKKVSAEINHFQQGIMHLKLEKNSFNGLYLQKDQHALLLRFAIIHLSEISTELEMLHATKTYLSNIQRKEVGQKEKKTPLQDVDSIIPEEDFATPEERKPDTIRNILLRQRDMKRGQVKALHKSLKSYQLISGNNIEFVKVLLKSQIHTCGNDILRLEEVLKEKKPSLKISPNEVKISEVRERQTKCQDLLRKLVKDTSPDHAKIEWCKMKCGKYHSILLYEGDKCYLREHRTRSKSQSSVVDDKTKRLVSRENSTAETQDASSSKTTKRHYDAVGKQPQGKNDQLSKRRKTGTIIQQRLAHEVTSAKGHVNPTADDATVETSAGRLGTSSQEQLREKEKPDRLEKTRPKLALTGNDCETWKPAVTSPCDLRQQQLDVTMKSSKSLVVTIFNPAAKGQAEDVSGRSSKACQDIFGESKGTKESDVTKKEAVPVASAVSSSISTDQDPSAQEQTTFPGIEVKGTWAKCPLDPAGAVKVKTADAKPIQTQLKNRTFYSPSRQAAVPGMHRTSSTANKQPLLPGPNMYSAVPYRYPVQNTPPRQVQYPTSHLRPRMNWWSQAPNFIHRPMFPPQSMFQFPNQQMFPNRWPTN